VSPLLPDVLPILLEQTIIIKELIRVVDLVGAVQVRFS
jgi:hypothetical protein